MAGQQAKGRKWSGNEKPPEASNRGHFVFQESRDGQEDLLHAAGRDSRGIATLMTIIEPGTARLNGPCVQREFPGRGLGNLQLLSRHRICEMPDQLEREFNMIEETCMPKYVLEVIEKQVQLYRNGACEPTVQNTIPETPRIPIDTPLDKPVHWLKIPKVTSVFVDMINSTKLSAAQHPKSTAKLYQLFTGTAVRIFDAFETPYIDVRGDGVLALFNENQCNRALAAAIAFKTFCKKEFIPRAQGQVPQLHIGAHIGIDRGDVLVRRIGIRIRNGDIQAQNEVWAGTTVNMSAKLASKSENGQLLVSDRFFTQIKSEYALKSCGCVVDDYGNHRPGEKKDLWTPESVAHHGIFDFDQAYRLDSTWCKIHGSEFCTKLLALDGQ